jgi:hypothetical protein
MMGGSYARVCKTGKPGTRQTLRSPAQSRHKANTKKSSFAYGVAVRLVISGGLADPITDEQ